MLRSCSKPQTESCRSSIQETDFILRFRAIPPMMELFWWLD